MRKLIRELFALPFLPMEHVRTAFTVLNTLMDVLALTSLMDYVESIWILSCVWSVNSWSIFNQSIRTNNDSEGWYHRLNHRGRGGTPPFYILVPMLHREALLVPLVSRFVSEKKTIIVTINYDYVVINVDNININIEIVSVLHCK